MTSDAEQVITFGTFDNRQRILFFFKFTGFNEADGVIFDCITDLSLKHDSASGRPTQPWLKWIDKNVEKVLLSGRSLEETEFMRDVSSWPHLLVWRMEAKFRYDTPDASGVFRALFEFADYATSKLASAEFQISIPHLTTVEKGKTSSDISALKKQFIAKLNHAKKNFYETAKNSQRSRDLDKIAPLSA